MADIFIPERTEQLTAEWLTSVLLERGHLKTARVTSVERENLSDGEGFLGVVSRLTLTLDREEAGAPRTLIAKLPTPVRENRTMAELMGAYRREILFYDELAAHVPARMPAALYSAFDEAPDREKEEELAAKLDRLPIWMVNAIMRWARFVASRRNFRYVLLLEDLAPGQVGDQVSGASLEQCEAVLTAIAGVHAKFWNHPMLAERSWLSRQDMNPRMRHGMYKKARRAFTRRNLDMMRDGLGTHLDWLDRNGLEVSLRLHGDAPRTLIHCDLRFDNVFFSEREPDGSATLFDWQLVGVGAAAYDVAYLLSGALRTDVCADDEMRLVRGYHDALVEAGVRDYPLEVFLRDYRLGLYLALVLVASNDDMDMGDGRGVVLMDEWAKRTFARLRSVDPETVLG